MKARGWVLTITGWLIMLGCLYGATLGIVVGAVTAILGYRLLWPKSSN
jgi:hypothetical protein